MSKSQSQKATFGSRSTARLVAVQALFQIEQTEESASTVVVEFMTHRLKSKEKRGSKADVSFFTKLVEGAWKIHKQSDTMIEGALKEGWTLDRIEPVTHAILRAALYELTETQTPPGVIMNEYLNIAHNFSDKAEVAFVNGVLNTLAQKIKPLLSS